MRLDAQTGVIENGLVYIPTKAAWLEEYLHELTTFPKSRFDDQVDSTSQALEWLKQRVPGWGIIEYYAQLAAGVSGQAKPRMTVLKVENDTSHVITITGQQIAVRPDRTIELPEEDARWLLVGRGF